MITKKRADRCVTHHYACDCREYRYERMESALKIIATWASSDLKQQHRIHVALALDPEAVVKICDKALAGIYTGEAK